jgi:AcrR family transcriptional regulator
MTTASASLPVQQRAWDTRERILAAALACLAIDGYAATTTSRIQERAGVSRGSLLHQFPSRDDLLIAAVHHLADQRASDLADPRPRDLDAAVGQLWSTFHGPLFRAALQLWVGAEHNEQLRAALAPRERELGRRIRSSVAELFGEERAAHPNFGELVTLLVSSMRGVALTYAFDSRNHRREASLPAWRRLAHRYLDD